jgi:heterodisulfide reductase subunit A-like polyferredoxin
MLCGDGRDAMDAVIDEHDLDQLVVTCPEPGIQRELREMATAHGLHPDAVEFVDQREGAGWVHEESAATDKTAVGSITEWQGTTVDAGDSATVNTTDGRYE